MSRCTGWVSRATTMNFSRNCSHSRSSSLTQKPESARTTRSVQVGAAGSPTSPERSPRRCWRNCCCPPATRTPPPTAPRSTPPGADAGRAWSPAACNPRPPLPDARPRAAGASNPDPARSRPAGWAAAPDTSQRDGGKQPRLRPALVKPWKKRESTDWLATRLMPSISGTSGSRRR